jgi:radical SAM protein with 4Fe4S-binding SPASM domain
MDERLSTFDATRDLRRRPFRSLCYAPDVQLSFSPNGNVSACCISRSQLLGNVQTERLDDIWHGERLRQFRAMLHDYVFPPGCESCRWALEAGSLVDHPIRYFDDVPISERSEWPTQLEFALSNTCNLACVMCNGEYSSVLRAREGLPPIPSSYGEDFFADLARYLPHARSLSFLGGEPFLQREAYRIWEMIIEMGLAIPCQVTTNGSILDERVERVLDRLPFNIAVSVDGTTKQTVESIRVNVKFERLMENIRRFNRYARGETDRFASMRRRRLQLNFCVMRQNWHEAGDFFLFAEELGCAVWKVFVTNPPGCSLFTLPQGDLEPIVESLEARRSEMERRLTLNRGVWFSLVEEARGHLGERPASLFDSLTRGTGDASLAARGGSPAKLVRAWQLSAQGRFQDAVREIESIPEDDPYYYQAKCGLGEFKGGLRDYEGAERELDEALSIASKRPEAHLIRAWLRAVEGRMEEAAVACRQATEAGAGLREVESRFVEQVLVPRLAGSEPLAALLAARWEPRPPPSSPPTRQTGRQRSDTSASSTIPPSPPRSK